MSRRQAILEMLVVFAVFCLQGMWPVPEVNEPYYLGKAIHYWNPHWASSDWFLHTTDAHTVFYFTAGWLSLLLKPTALAWTLRLATWALLAASWQRLSAAIVPRAWASVLTATLFLYLLQHYNMAGEWVVGGAESKGFSFVLVFFALTAMVEGCWNRMWLLLGLATAMHALVGGWALIAAGMVWITRNWNTKRLPLNNEAQKAPGLDSGDSRAFTHHSTPLTSWIGPGIALLLASPGVVPPLLMNRGADKDTLTKAAKIYVFERFPHHLDPVKMWNDGYVLPYLAMTGCWLLLWNTVSDSAGARRLRNFTAAALGLSLIGTALGILGLYHRDLAAGWMRFYWFRLADVAVPMCLSLLAVRWVVARRMRLALGFAVAVASFHAADCVVLRYFADPPFNERDLDGAAWRAAWLWTTGHRGPNEGLHPIFPRQPRADKQRDYRAWLDVCRWVADHTPPDARFIVPRVAYTFKWYAARGEVVNWKDSPQDAANLLEWWKRIQDIYATGNPPPQDRYYGSLADAGPARLRQLAEKYQADYLVTQVSTPLLPLAILYKNDAFVVYKIR